MHFIKIHHLFLRAYLKPLVRMIKKETVPDDIRDSLVSCFLKGPESLKTVSIFFPRSMARVHQGDVDVVEGGVGQIE